MSANANNERFSILKNGVDDRLEIIRDNKMKFYNITKTAKMIANLRESEENNENQAGNEIAQIRAISNKVERARKWFENSTTITLIAKCKEITGLDEVNYTLRKGYKPEFQGIYVHKKLYDHFLIWLNPTYAMLVSEILDNIHEEKNRKLIQELGQKEDAITELKQAIQKQSEEAKARDEEAKARDKAQTNKINQLLDFGNKITKQQVELIERTEHLQITADMTQEDLDKSLRYNKEILNYLVDKSYKSTMDPGNPNQITHFAAFKPIDPTNTRTILTRGQLKRVNDMKAAYANTHTMIINTTYNANAINLIINAKVHYEEERDEYIARHNAPIIEHNDQLKEEIKAYNRRNKNAPRIYLSEKRPLLYIKDIPIKFGTTSISYVENPHISYEKVIQSIMDINTATQASPAEFDQSESESDESDSE